MSRRFTENSSLLNKTVINHSAEEKCRACGFGVIKLFFVTMSFLLALLLTRFADLIVENNYERLGSRTIFYGVASAVVVALLTLLLILISHVGKNSDWVYTLL